MGRAAEPQALDRFLRATAAYVEQMPQKTR
jgi:hypothetical protein